ncbi:SdrD B-like domain-containing protein [Streptomyces sp. NPDC004111]|uniref:SdrD B-like domain-containing protein n=1 Tax=Streptomyces sp. NPDC004111 TaxID=3364690 RepID=UPI0036BBE929
MTRRVGALSVVLPVMASGAVLSVQSASADAGDGSAKIRVVREVNANGKWDQVLEPGLGGVTVVLTDADGRSITGKTAADGTVTLAPGAQLRGGKYRVEVKNPKPGVMFPGFASPKDDLSDPTVLSSNVEFVDLKGGQDAEVTTSFWNPADYCQKNAELLTACIGKDVEGFNDPDTRRTLVGFPYDARGVDNQTTNLSDKATTGALYGIGWSKQKKWVFSGALAKRGSKYGPGGPGAIYLTDRQSEQTSLFTTVPNVGDTAHDMSRPDMDVAFAPTVTKESLGDVEVSEDGKDLYVVNLNDKKLYRYDATQKTAAAPKGSYTIPNPGCGDDWRPFGLGVQDGTVYVGGVCSAESTQDKADMRAVIHTFNPKTSAFTGTVMDEKLDFPRGIADTFTANCAGKGWFPWKGEWPSTEAGARCAARSAYPQPVLGDIVVDTDGELILGFRDRFGDQFGWDMPRWSGDAAVGQATMGGDLNRACKGADGKFKLDGNGGCTNNAATQPNGGQSADVKEFYPGDYRTGYHQEAAFSGIALSKVEDSIASSGIDVVGALYNAGTMHVNRDGSREGNAQAGNQLTDIWGKGGGMADLEVLCDEAPFQIGNRVWYDNGKRQKNGIQDPDEKPVVGATVNLYDKDNKKIGTTKTNARGEYYFDSTLVKNVAEADWVYGRKYFVRMDNPADYAAGGVLEGYEPTQFGKDGNMMVDSKGKPYGNGGRFAAADVKIDGAGENDHDIDFGFLKPTQIILSKISSKDSKPVAGAVFQLWQESNGVAGLQRTGAKRDMRRDECATDSMGKCTFDKIKIGSYYLVETAVPEGFELPVGNRAVTGPLKVTDRNCEKNPVRVTLKNKPKEEEKKKK